MSSAMSRIRWWVIRRLIRAERTAAERRIPMGWDRSASLDLDRLLAAEEVLSE